MIKTKILIVTACAFGLTACGDYESLDGGFSQDKSFDRGIDKKHLSQLQAGIWIDPNGCDHWIIDDGVEGYLSARLDKRGKPVCSGVAPPNHTVGDFKGGSDIVDPN
ncbi:hypothetical protein [Sulfitobacter sp. SK011]|uniref:hypothetical protein n=1 Tax=Sulfitobacter sp. SK011 TaxID=1389004 RepID=UPI0019625B61|nr:hypothetical protein [Sulfitobacter sp. SK011]